MAEEQHASDEVSKSPRSSPCRYTRKKNNASSASQIDDGPAKTSEVATTNQASPASRRSAKSPRISPRQSPKKQDSLSETKLDENSEIPEHTDTTRVKSDGDGGRTVRKSRRSRKAVARRGSKNLSCEMPTDVSKPDRVKIVKVRSNSAEECIRNDSFRGFVKDLKESESNGPMHIPKSPKSKKSHPAVVGASTTLRLGRNQARTLRGRLTTGCLRQNESFRREKSSKKLMDSSSQLSLPERSLPSSPTCHAVLVAEMNASFTTGMKW